MKRLRTPEGFTIIELLTVIVVIAILATISVVAYNGIQARAKTAAAQSAASSAIKKAELYLAYGDTNNPGSYPGAGTDLTFCDASYPYCLDGVTWGTPSATAAPSVLAFYTCGTGATTAQPVYFTDISTTTGVRIDYYDYQTKTVKSLSAGVASGLVGTYNVGCFLNNEVI